MNEVILSREEAAKINGSNIQAVFKYAQEILVKRERLFDEYDKPGAMNELDFDIADMRLFAPIPKYATNIAAGYFIGSPCKYYARTNTTIRQITATNGQPKTMFKDVSDDKHSKADNVYLDRYRAILRRQHEDEENMRLAKSALICGTAYERLYTAKRGGLLDPHFRIVDARKSMMFHDQTVERTPTAFIVREDFISVLDGTKSTRYELITQDKWVFYTFDGIGNAQETVNAAGIPILNVAGIPIVEYPMPDRKSYFEDVLPLIRARDFLLNNLKNTFKYNDEAILLLIGYMRPDSDEDERELREQIDKFKTMYLGEDNKVEWLIKSVDIESVGGYFKMLTDDIYASLGQTNPTEIAQVYQNIQAVRYQNYGMDNTIIALERCFERSLLEGRAQKIAALMNAESKTQSYNWEVLDVTFSRNIPSSSIEEAQFMTQAKAAGLLADVDILDMVSFVEDSTAAHKRKLEQDEAEARADVRAIKAAQGAEPDGEAGGDDDGTV